MPWFWRCAGCYVPNLSQLLDIRPLNEGLTWDVGDTNQTLEPIGVDQCYNLVNGARRCPLQINQLYSIFK